MEDNLVEDLVEDQGVAHEGTGVADAGEDPLSSTCASAAVKFTTNLQKVRKILMELLA